MDRELLTAICAKYNVECTGSLVYSIRANKGLHMFFTKGKLRHRRYLGSITQEQVENSTEEGVGEMVAELVLIDLCSDVLPALKGGDSRIFRRPHGASPPRASLAPSPDAEWIPRLSTT